MQSLPNNKVN